MSIETTRSETDIPYTAVPETDVSPGEEPAAGSRKHCPRCCLLPVFLCICLLSIAGFLYLYEESEPIVIPENAEIRYFLEGKEVKEKDLLTDMEYRREVKDLDTGKIQTDSITFYDRNVPTITVDPQRLQVQIGTGNIKGLHIEDNYDAYEDLTVQIEGIDYDRPGEYDITIEVSDTSGNCSKISATAWVQTEDYIEDGEQKKRDFSDYVRYDFTSPISEKEVE